MYVRILYVHDAYARICNVPVYHGVVLFLFGQIMRILYKYIYVYIYYIIFLVESQTQ